MMKKKSVLTANNISEVERFFSFDGNLEDSILVRKKRQSVSLPDGPNATCSFHSSTTRQ